MRIEFSIGARSAVGRIPKESYLMNRKRKLALGLMLGVFAAVGAAVPAAAALGFFTSVQPYAVTTTSDYKLKPLISAGDIVPETTNAAKSFKLVGIPDGMGAYKNRNQVKLMVNHELRRSVTSEPVVGDPLNRGAFVSELTLGKDGSVLSGKRAYDDVFVENALVGPAADTTNSTSAFARFCSGFLATSAEGFSEPVYLAGEEADGADTFDGHGGQAVAIYRNEAHVLPRLGHLAWENAVVLPHTGRRTVVMGMEDGPSTPDSQLWMYVGTKVPGASSVLRRNGLDNGRLYVFVADGKVNEEDLRSGSVTGSWVHIPGADGMADVQLEAAADAVNAFGFVRVEDGAASPIVPGMYHFVTTGSSYTAPGATTPANKLGRLYRLNVNAHNPTGGAKLTVVYNADEVIAAGGDTAVSPDNMEDNGRFLMVQEDGTAESRPVMGSNNRDGSIWRYDMLAGYAADRVAELDPPGRDGVAVGPGVWESSGIIDAQTLFGHNSWLLDVQAHGPTAAPAPGTVEDGQILLLTRR